MTKPTMRRVLAYIFDIIIVTIICSAIASVKFLNPYRDQYTKAVEDYNSYISELSSNPNRVSMLFSDEQASTLIYDVAHYGVYTNIVSLVITFLYFVVFQYYTKGKTAGKLIMGIEVISTKDKKLKFEQLLIRSAIFNSLITSTLLVICVSIFNMNTYTTVSSVIEIIDLGLILGCIGMVIYRADGVGLHDYLAHTRVILAKEKDLLGKEVKEAKVVKVKEK